MHIFIKRISSIPRIHYQKLIPLQIFKSYTHGFCDFRCIGALELNPDTAAIMLKEQIQLQIGDFHDAGVQMERENYDTLIIIADMSVIIAQSKK